MQSLLQNLRYALRSLWKNPALTLTVLLTLALGIGATTAIFTVDYATLLAPLPYPQPNQLMIVWSKARAFRNPVSAGDYLDWKQQNHSFQQLAAYREDTFNIATADQPENIDGLRASPGYYDALVGPGGFFLGRDFLSSEGTPGNDHVAILTYKLWKHLGSDTKLTQPVRINGEIYTVVGVLPPGVYDLSNDQLTVPLSFTPEQQVRGFRLLKVLGRLRPGITQQQAQADMDTVATNIAQAYPATNRNWGAVVNPLQNEFLPKNRKQTLWYLLGAFAFVLLIACVNVANLLLARGMSRQKELAIRCALGASRRTIFAQILTESLILAFTGGLLGIGVGYGLLRALTVLMPPNTVPIEAQSGLHLNLPVLAGTIALTMLSGLLFGYAPAWYASRIDPNHALKEGGHAGAGGTRQRLRQALVIGECALALSLLTGAGLAIHSFRNILNVDLGLRTDHVLTYDMPVPATRPRDPERIVAYYRQIISRIQSLPGVTSVTAMTGNPLYGPPWGLRFSIAGKDVYNDPSARPTVRFAMVSPGFFQTYGVQIVQGRDFNEQDIANGVHVAVVNEDFAAKFLKGIDPLVQRVTVQQLVPGAARPGPDVDWQIVGVYHNIRSLSLDNYPAMYVPFWQSPWPESSMAVRTAGDPSTMLRSVAAAVHAIDPEIALRQPMSMDELRGVTLADDRFTLILFAAFAALALLLATLGIYGVMSFSVAQRKREIALRMALGSGRNRAIALIVKEGIALASIGLAIGLIGAYFIGRSMQSMLYNVGKFDLPVFAAVAFTLLAAALLACFIPARRAASVQPMQALRTE